MAKARDSVEHEKPQDLEQQEQEVTQDEPIGFEDMLKQFIGSAGDEEFAPVDYDSYGEQEQEEQEQEEGEGEEEVEAAVEEAAERMEEEALTEEEVDQAIDMMLDGVEGKGGRDPEIEAAKQLWEFVSRDPEAYNAILSVIQKKSAKQEPPIPKPKVEEIPKPEDFDPTEAWDPTTPSGRWVQAQLTKSIAESVSPVFEELAKKVSAIERWVNTVQQREVQREQQEQVKQVLGEFVSRNPDVEPHLDDFIQFLHNPSGVTLDDLWNLFATKRGITAKAAQQIAASQRTQARPKTPPAAHIGGKPETQQRKMSLGEQLSDLLLSMQKEVEY